MLFHFNLIPELVEAHLLINLDFRYKIWCVLCKHISHVHDVHDVRDVHDVHDVQDDVPEKLLFHAFLLGALRYPSDSAYPS